MQQHLVFGSGLIGGFLGGALINSGISSSFVGRAKTQQEMTGGLVLSDYLGNQASITRPIFVTTKQPTVDQFDVIWLTIKCTSLSASIKSLSQFVAPNTTIICCQNGLGSDSIIRRAFPNNNILLSVVGFNVANPKPGHLHRSTQGELVIENDTHSTIIQDIIDQANSGLLPMRSSDQIVAEQWAKLQLNLANPVNALADIPVKVMTENIAYRKIIAALMKELLLVCDALGLDLPKVTAVPAKWIPILLRLPNWIFKPLAKKMLAIDPNARTSMWWDISNGRQTEIDYLNATVVNVGQRHGIKCPVNKRIIKLIKQVESGDKEIGLKPESLAQYLWNV